MTRAELIANMKTRFSAMDANHDGVLDSAEVAAAQQKEVDEARAVAQQRANAEFAALDTNHDGQLSKAEFMAAIPAVKANDTPQQIIGSFDSNKDGKISLAEFQAPRTAVFDKIDTNHDGTISPQELDAARGSQR
jgi:Ca2+-binding EF-hand superfamily protein